MRIEYLKLVCEVVVADRRDAWDPFPKSVGGLEVGEDCPSKQRARRAWLELLMFPKSVLRQNKRGQRRGQAQALAFTKALIARWSLGERRGLWDEAVMVSQSRSAKRRGLGSQERTEAEVRRLVALDRPGQAIKRLVSPRLAENNEHVRHKLLAKFPSNPSSPLVRTALAPTPDIPLPTLLKALHSFPVGSGPGPDGLRADFLKGVVGHSVDSEGLGVLKLFIQMLADADVSDALQPLAGGTLVGVGKMDKNGHPIPLIGMRAPLLWGRCSINLPSSVPFNHDSTEIRERLLPHQLVVAVAGGAEGLIHAARQWIAIHRQEEDMVLLQKDVKNAFNTVLSEEFLYDCRRFAPASARLAEYCNASESNLVYDGTVYRSSRGQQGCPMMMVLFCLTRKRHAEEAAALCGVVPPFRPEYADDGFSGSRVQRS